MEQIPPLYEHKQTCHMCRTPFTTYKIRSKFIKVEKYDTDFCPIYKPGSENGLLYHIFVCPHCGYSYSEDFSPFFAPGVKEKIQSNICDRWVPHNFGKERTATEAIKTLKLAFYTGSLKKEKHIILAGISMRMAWLYRMNLNTEQENRFLSAALHEYKESYSTGDFSSTSMSETRLLYLLGEIAYRCGKLEEATMFLSKVIEKQKYTMETGIIEMAKDRWLTIRETRNKVPSV
ncbi:DUF2225 domain-containing protein [Bacillus testis]|uniref:DUF2225 domain-containing protein n=1 Tax=Bacillus testis TaxID=1622072 RepID=UPI00067EF004|nr:DUF2225 domain-containing protein [Bacillus testis]